MKNAVRVGRIKLKSGGEIVPLRTKQRDDIQKDLAAAVEYVSGSFKDGELDGFVVIGWDKQANYQDYVVIQADEDSMVGPTIAGPFVHNIILKRAIHAERDGE